MTYGYIRVSTDKQTVENQRYEILSFAKRENLHVDGWVEETVSGTKDPAKRKLGPLLNDLRPDDLLVCAELSRLGRSLFMILEVLNLCMKKNVRVWTIKDNYRLGDDISSKVLAFAFGLSAEIERNLISQRTKEALARKRAEGVKLGRPRGRRSDRVKLSGQEDRIRNLFRRGLSRRRIAKRLHVDRATLAKFLLERYPYPIPPTRRTRNVPLSSPTQACLAQDDKGTLLQNLPAYVRSHAHTLAFPPGGASWAILSPIEQSIKEKIERYGTPLKDWGVEIKRGVLTGLNEAFILDGKTKDRLIAQDPRSAEIIRPILRGRDIKRYGYTFADKWLIATHNGYGSVPRVNINHYPAVKDWLDAFGDKLRKRTDKGDTPYNLRDCAYWSLFSQPKIVWMELTTPATFALDEHGYYLNNTCYILTSDTVNLRYILAFLNSSLCVWYFDKICATSGVGTRRWIKQYIEQIRLPSSINWSPRGEVNDLQFFCAAFHLSEDERNLFA